MRLGKTPHLIFQKNFLASFDENKDNKVVYHEIEARIRTSNEGTYRKKIQEVKADFREIRKNDPRRKKPKSA